MLFVLSEMDGILRNVLGLPAYGGKKETVNDLLHTKKWMNYNHLAKSYLGNALYVLNQMTDTQMISFTLRRLKFSSVLLVAFPALLQKYIKVWTIWCIISLFSDFFMQLKWLLFNQLYWHVIQFWWMVLEWVHPT